MAELSYRRHIDGLRAVAVMAVVAFHAGVPWLPGGYVGVDVFFVVSGFLITGLLLREFEASGDISLVGFYERRVRRLAPALLLVLVVTLVLGAVFLVPIGGEQQGLAKSTIATLLLGSNVWFAHASGGYFDAPAAAQPLLHTWSLSVEEQFYLVWPALLLLTSRWAKRHGNDPARAAAATLALVGLASLLLSIFHHPTPSGICLLRLTDAGLGVRDRRTGVFHDPPPQRADSSGAAAGLAGSSGHRMGLRDVRRRRNAVSRLARRDSGAGCGAGEPRR